MEFSVLSTVFKTKVTTFPKEWRPTTPNGQLCGYASTWRMGIRRALLFVTPDGSWLWNNGQRNPVPTILTLPQQPLHVLEVHVYDHHIYIHDMLVYESRILICRDYLERMEAARKWAATYTGNKTMTPTLAVAYRSAYPTYTLENLIHLNPVCPPEYATTIRPPGATSLLYVPLLDRYHPTGLD